MGQPDCRYGLVSYSNSTDDLFKLDQLFYELRRRTIGLEWIVGSNWNDDFLRGFYGQPYRNVIEQLPHYQIREMNVPTGAFEVVGSNLEDIHFSWNCPFARTVQDIEKPAPTSVATTFPGSGNSYLFLLWNELNGKTITQETREQVSWLLDNVWVGKDAENEFRELLTNK